MVSATSDLACSKSTDGITMEYGCSLTRYQLICLVIQTFTSGVLSLPQVQPALSVTAKAVSYSMSPVWGHAKQRNAI